jgi:PKD repeat protein
MNVILGLGCIGHLSCVSQIIPTNRTIAWSSQICGVPGGIPKRTSIYATFKSGATVAQINTAIANCPSNQLVILEAGNYTLSSPINFGTQNGVVLRGAGMSKTILNFTTTDSYCIGNDEYNFDGASLIASGYSKGSTSIVLSTKPNPQFSSGNMMLIDEEDDTDFVFASGGPGRHIQFQVRITSVSGNTINFFPPLPWTLKSNLSPKASYHNGGPGLRMAGIEDMTINNNGSGGGANDVIAWWNADSCWVKNVEITKGNNSFIFFVDSMNCEVRHCKLHDAYGYPLNTDGYGVYLYGSSAATSFCLVEDNIIYNLFVGAWQTASSGNAFLYNYFTNGVAQGFVHQLGVMNAGHGPHPMMCLWEGNIGEQWQHDGYHGSASHQTVFRNWIHGLSKYSDNRKMIDVARGSYYFNIVGNILGDPSWTNDPGFQYEMTGSPGYDEASVIYRLGYPNMANNSVTMSEVGNPWPSSYGLTYPDPKSKSTLLRHGNYDWKNRSIIWDPAISDHNIPNSLFYSSKPAYFGNCPWPPFDPFSPSSVSVTNIPAGYRYVYGVDPASGPVNQAPSAVATANPTSGIPPLSVTFSSSGSSDPEGKPLTYRWTFGDGSALATSANPAHSYQTAGSYSAQLTISDGTNSATSAVITIKVGNQPPTVHIASDVNTGRPPLAVAFSSAGSSDPEGQSLTYSWNFGDGSPISNAANPSHTYQNNGTFAAKLTVSDGVNSASSGISISVTSSSGLVAAYSFDADAGPTITDISGNGNSGVINTAHWTNSGKFGNALSFDGVSSATVTDSPSLDLTGSLTLEAWVMPTSFTGDFQPIIIKPMDSSFNQISYVLQGSSRPSKMPSIGLSASPENLMGPSPLPLNMWSHLAGTYDGSTVRLYVNGVQVASEAVAGPITTSTEAIRIGMSWAGVIDEVRIYNRAISASEIQSDMKTPISPKPAPPTGLLILQP